MGVFAGALIKKRCFWPKYITGDAIDNRLAGNNMGDVAAVEGYLDDTIYNVWAMKEPNYTMKIMGTASGLFMVDDKAHTRKWTENGITNMVSFPYHEPFSLHFTYGHVVDDHKFTSCCPKY